MRRGMRGGGDEHYDNAYAIKNGDTTTVGIRTLGCALSCMAMAMTAFGDTVTPGELNEFKKDTSTDQRFRFDEERVRWSAIDGLSSSVTKKPVDTDSSFGISSLDPFLEQCELIIAKVFNPNSVAHKSKTERERAERYGNHWVLIKRKDGINYEIVDPGRGSVMLSEYGRIYRFIRVQKS